MTLTEIKAKQSIYSNLTIEDLKNFYEENLIVLVDELGTGTPTWLYKIDPKNNATLYDVFNLLQCTKNSYVGFPYEVLSSKPQTIANVKTLKACIEYVERLKVMLNDLVFTVNNSFRGFVMSNTGDVIVDWGDGIIQHFAGGSSQLRAHVYPNYPEASYEIKVKAPLITLFDINHDNNGSVTANSLERITKLPSTLTNLQLGRNTTLTDAPVIKNNTSLQTVSMIGAGITVAPDIDQMAALTTLDLSYCKLPASEINSVLSQAYSNEYSERTIVLNGQTPIARPYGIGIVRYNDLLLANNTITVDEAIENLKITVNGSFTQLALDTPLTSDVVISWGDDEVSMYDGGTFLTYDKSYEAGTYTVKIYNDNITGFYLDPDNNNVGTVNSLEEVITLPETLTACYIDSQEDITDFDFNLPALQLCFIYGNSSLATVDISAATTPMLVLSGNALTSLTVSGCPKIALLDVSNNALTTLNLESNPLINDLSLNSNDFSASAFDNILTLLYDNGLEDGNLLLQTQDTPVKYADLSVPGKAAYDALELRNWTIQIDAP